MWFSKFSRWGKTRLGRVLRQDHEDYVSSITVSFATSHDEFAIRVAQRPQRNRAEKQGEKIRVGYLRGGGDDESILEDVGALEGAGCVRVVVESGPRRNAPGPAYTALIQGLSAGDTVLVVRLDHLSASLPQLVDRLADLLDRGIAIETLGEPVHIDPSVGGLIHHMQALPRRSGAAHTDGAGHERGTGRPRRLGAAEIARARQLIGATGRSIEDVAHELGVSRATLYRSLKNA